MEGKIKWTFNSYVPYVYILEFLEGEWKDMGIPMECNIYKNFLNQPNVK